MVGMLMTYIASGGENVTVVFLGLRVGRNPNLVPRVFSLFNMVAAQEKTLAHSRSHGQNLQRGRRFIQNGKRSEKIWVRDMAKAKINKMAEEAEVQFKKKRGKKVLVFLFLVSFLLF